MMVAFKIAAGFGHYAADLSPLIAGIDCAIEPDQTVAWLMASVGFPPTVAVHVFVNGRLGTKQTRLGDGDSIFLAQPMAGG